VNLTARDRKIVLILIPLVLLGAYWFFALAPKRAESAEVADQLAQAQSKRDAAQAQVGQLDAAKRSFAGDYATVIRMGKAVPETVDMPSLLVQLDRAARGTGIEIKNIKVDPAKGSDGSAAPASTPTGGGGPSAGGSGAQSPQGKMAQTAGNKVNDANAKTQGGADAANQAGGASAGGSAAPTAPGLQSVGLQFQVKGTFFDMADFFHRMKRFVRVVNDQIVVRGRLISIDTFNFQNQGDSIKADIGATIWLSPKTDGGVSAGASPAGPVAGQGAAPAGSSPSPSTSPTPAAPAATATP
jgi:hypothetical protein